jgi:hypothetical protein
VAVLLVHHEPRGGTNSAGLYIWESEPRWRLWLSMVGEGPYRTLTAEGNAVTDLPPVLGLRMPRKGHSGSRFALADGRNTVPEDRSGERMDQEDQLLLGMLGRSDWASQSEIAKALRVSQSKVSRVLGRKGYRLQDGQLVKVEGTPAGVLFIHSPLRPPD